MTDRNYAFWVFLGKIRHLVGIHSWVPLEEWDLDDGSFRYIGMVCWHCPTEIR